MAVPMGEFPAIVDQRCCVECDECGGLGTSRLMVEVGVDDHREYRVGACPSCGGSGVAWPQVHGHNCESITDHIDGWASLGPVSSLSHLIESHPEWRNLSGVHGLSGADLSAAVRREHEESHRRAYAAAEALEAAAVLELES